MYIDFYQIIFAESRKLEGIKRAGGRCEVVNSSWEKLQSNFSRDSRNVLKAALSFVSIWVSNYQNEAFI